MRTIVLITLPSGQLVFAQGKTGTGRQEPAMGNWLGFELHIVQELSPKLSAYPNATVVQRNVQP